MFKGTKPQKGACTSLVDKTNAAGKKVEVPCGRTLLAIPYKRRDEDAKALNCYICPSCDQYNKWPREQL